MTLTWRAAIVAIFVSLLFVGCGGTPTTPAPNSGGIGQGPPMAPGEKSPLMGGSAEDAEKMGRGPGRGDTPEGYKNQGVPPSGSGPGSGQGSGPPQ
jgi:hypothetical protein